MSVNMVDSEKLEIGPEQEKPARSKDVLSFLVISLIPAVVFLLISGLWLLLAYAAVDNHIFLEKILDFLVPQSFESYGTRMAVAAFLAMIWIVLLPLLIVLPAMISFFINLIWPVMRTWQKAASGGLFFLLVYCLEAVPVLIYRNTSINQRFIFSSADAVFFLAALAAGLVLMISVILLSRYGALLGLKRRSRKAHITSSEPV